MAEDVDDVSFVQGRRNSSSTEQNELMASSGLAVTPRRDYRGVTAEIAIMNRNGIALAADSAVSIGYGGRPKIFNSVNKLFAASKRAPVGVMVFGNATRSMNRANCSSHVSLCTKRFNRQLRSNSTASSKRKVS